MTLRVCQIVLARHFAGGVRLPVDLCIELQQAGVDVLAICRTGSKAAAILGQEGVRCHTIPALGWWDPLAPRRIRRIVEDFDADIVHTHLPLATYLTKKARIQAPFVVSLHNYHKMEYHAGGDHYIPVTEDGIEPLRDMGVPGACIHLIPNFSRIPAVTEVPTRRNAIPQILAYGTFIERKGFHILLRALGRLKRSGLDFRLTLGGGGPWQGKIESEAVAQGLTDRVHLAGWLNDVQVALDATDLFVMPSLAEPFGLVLLEAMARGVPVVTTRTEGPRAFLSEETAYLCNIADTESLAAAIESALMHPEERRQRANCALNLFRTQFSVSAVIPEFINLYEQLRPEAYREASL